MLFGYGRRAGLMGIALAVLAVVALAAATALVMQLPDQVPMGIAPGGAVTRYGSRLELLIIPAICVVLAVGTLVRAHREGRLHADSPTMAELAVCRTLRSGLITQVILLAAAAYVCYLGTGSF